MTLTAPPTPTVGAKSQRENVDPDDNLKRSVVLILGMHRSGTSAFSRVANLLGAKLPDKLIAPLPSNESGHWEPAEINWLNEEILPAAGSSWDDWRRFNPDWYRSPVYAEFRKRALRIMDDSYGGAPLCLIKDPRICRLLPFWADVIHSFGAEPLCVIPLRNPMEVAFSLRERDGFDLAKSQMLWLRHCLDAENDSRRLRRVFVTYEQLLQSWSTVADKISTVLDIAWPRRSATAVVEIERYLSSRGRHHVVGADEMERHPEIADWVGTAYRALLELADDPNSTSTLATLDALRSEFDRACDALGPVLRAEEIRREEADQARDLSTKQMADLEAAAASRQKQLAELELSLSARDVRLGELRKALAASAERAEKSQSEVLTRDTRVAALQTDVSARDARIEALNAAISDRDTHIGDLQATAFVLEAQNTRLQIRVSKEAELAVASASHLKHVIETSAQESEQLRQRVDELTRNLLVMESSTFWQVSHPVRKAVSRLPSWLRRGLRRVARLVWWTVTLQLPRRLRAYRDARYPPSSTALEVSSSPLDTLVDETDSVGLLHAATAAEPGPFLPAKSGPRVLIIDSQWPQPDRDSGSVDAMNQIRLFRALGYRIFFAADEYDKALDYRAKLEDQGIFCLPVEHEVFVEDFIRLEGGTIDLFFLSRIYCGGRFLETIRRHNGTAKVVFNTVDLHHLREEREARVKGDRRELACAAATRERELYLVRQADATIVVSETEQKLLEKEVPGAAVYDIPLSRQVRSSIPGFESRTGIGFVGGFMHTPNVDAVRFFLSDVWPLVHARLPNCTFFIAGPNLPEEALAAVPAGVRYLGHVPDLDAWLDGLRLTVAPLRYGAGAKGKVASSLANGVPCVATPVAAEGMGLESGVNIVIADGAAEIAEQIVSTYADRDRWSLLSKESIRFAEKELSAEVIDRRLVALLGSLGLPAAP